MTIGDIITRLQAEPGGIVSNPPAAPEDICKAEKSLGISIPAEYRIWLSLSDGGEVFPPGLFFYGVSAGVLHVDELLAHVNRAYCKRDVLHIPDNLMIIGRTCFGDYICFDAHESGKIVQWDVEGSEVFLAWDSLAHYLVDQWLTGVN